MPFVADKHNLTSGAELHCVTYYDHRTIAKDFQHILFGAARVRATEALKSVVKNEKEVVSFVQSKFAPLDMMQVMHHLVLDRCELTC